MLDLIAKNNEMLESKSYKLADERTMLKISSLDNPNEYDLYLIACCLCNYPIDEKADARELRLKYFKATNNGQQYGFEHPITDYKKITTSVTCTNTGNVNKYGLYEYEININDRDMVSDFWAYKAKNCLKYVDSKTYDDKIVVSISRDQLDNFTKLLDTYMITYDLEDIEAGLFYKNKSANKLVDLSTLNLPFKPYPFQLEDAQKIVRKKRLLLGHDMGCGKTFISVLVGESVNMPKLVVCPESLRLNWYREIKNVKADADVQIQLRGEEPHFGKDWTIIGYSSVSKFLDELKANFNCIFVDECHACKAVNNWGKPSSKRADVVIQLAENAEYCYLLSGTPMPSHNKDLFNILRMLKCEAFDFNSKWAFLNYAKQFCDPKETYFGKDFSGNSNSDQLHALLSNIMVRRLKKDVLPDLKKQRQFIPMEPKFKKDYVNIERRLYKPDKDDTYMGLAMTGRQLLSNYKIETAIDLAESLIEAGESVVLVTNFIESANNLRDHFKTNCCEIRGGMSDATKQKAVDDFQSKKVQVCILNMQAGGVGITLTAAHTMIVVDYAWLPSDMTQVEDRICRSGQKESCMIYYVYCVNSTLDSLFIEMISNKSANIDLVVDNTENTFNLLDTKEHNATFIDALKAKIKSEKPVKKTRIKRGA